MSRLTGEVVELCHANSGRDIEILEDEKMIAAKQNNKNTFLAWAASVVPAQRCKWIEENILKIEQFAVSSGLISGSIFSYTNTIKYQLGLLDVEYAGKDLPPFKICGIDLKVSDSFISVRVWNCHLTQMAAHKKMRIGQARRMWQESLVWQRH